MEEFIIYHDDQPDTVVAKVESALSNYRLRITMIEGGDGYEKYRVISDEEITEQSPTIRLSDLRQ